jgi:predicted transcriptional regulator
MSEAGRFAFYCGVIVMDEQTKFLDRTTGIVTAFVAKNSVPAAELPQLIQAVHASLTRLGQPVEEAPAGAKAPAVNVKKSITSEYLICLEDGRKFKSLKRHLKTKYGMSPEEYRSKWNLPKDYPMVAPSYSASRSALAKQMGLGSGGKAKPKVARSRKAAAE